MSTLPASIGLSISDKKCYYLIWVPSESGPMVIDYDSFKHEDNLIPFDYLSNKVKEHNVSPRFSISLNNNLVKYDYSESYGQSTVDSWNKNNFYDKNFQKFYYSYLYDNNKGTFSIHISKTIKEDIVSQTKKYNYNLINLGVGIFSALDGVRSWFELAGLEKYIIIKFGRGRMIELLMIHDNQFSYYMTLKKQSSNFNIIDFFGNNKDRKGALKIIENIFSKELDSIKSKIFYYSVDGNKEDVEFLLNLKTDKIELINPLGKIVFDDSCVKKISDVNGSAYSELGNLFRGIDV